MNAHIKNREIDGISESEMSRNKRENGAKETWNVLE